MLLTSYGDDDAQQLSAHCTAGEPGYLNQLALLCAETHGTAEIALLLRTSTLPFSSRHSVISATTGTYSLAQIP